MKRRILSALCTLFFLAALCPTPGLCTSGGGGGGGSAVGISPAYYSRPSDPLLAEAYDLGLLRWIQPEADYTSFVGNTSESLTRLECAELLAAFCNLSVPYTWAGSFTDTGNLPAVQQAIMIAVCSEPVMAGYSDESFRPNDLLTRGAVCKLLCDALFGLRSAILSSMVSDDWYNVDTSPYPDVKADNMFAAYIAHCKEYGIVSPYPDGNFYPADPISREIMIKWLLAAVKVRDRLPDYLFVFPPRNAVIQDGYRDPVTSESVGTFTELAVFVKTKQPNSSALFAAVFYEAGQFKGMGIIPETLQNHISGVVYIPISGQPLSGSTTVKLYALDTNTLRPLSPPAVFDLMP